MKTGNVLSLNADVDIERGKDDDDVVRQILDAPPASVQHGYGPYGPPPYAAARSTMRERVTHTRRPDGTMLTRTERFHRSTHGHHHAHGGWWWGGDSSLLCGLLFVGFFFMGVILLAAVASTSSYYRGHVRHEGGPGYHPHGKFPGYPARQDAPKPRKKKSDCAVGENWDPSLQHCTISKVLPVAVDRTLMDEHADPCVDFEQYACGSWNADPAHVDGTRSFDAIVEQNEREVAAIIRSRDNEGVHAFYRSCVEYILEGKHRKLNDDERFRLHALLTGELNTVGDLPEVLALMRRSGMTGPFMMEVMNHPTKTTAIPVFSYDGFDRKETSQRSIRDVFHRAGDNRKVSSAKAALMQDILNLLQGNAPDEQGDYLEYLASDKFSRDLMTFRQFKDLAFGGGGWTDEEWDRYLSRLYGQARRIKDEDEVWVPDQEYFRQLDIRQVLDVPKWRVYVDYSIAYHTTDFFPRIPHPAYFRDHHPLRHEHRYTRVRRFVGRSKEPRDGPEAPDRVPQPTEFDCVRATQMLLPGLVSDAWLRSNPKLVASFPEVGRIMRYVVDEYPRMISETPELSNATKEALSRKYQKLVIRVGHPKEWHPEPFAERIRADHFVHNVQMVWEYRGQRMMELWRDGKALDRDSATRFRMPLSTVNAFYSPDSNTFSIFPGILRYPFYDPAMRDESKFAGIGMVGAHEGGHGSDKSGVYFDDEGNYRQFYTEEEMRQMKERHACLIPHYVLPQSAGCDDEVASQYGVRTLGENVADLLGITASLRAYHRYKQDNGGEVHDQRFFLSYAQNWCSAPSSERICALAEIDVHAQGRDRINQPLKQTPQFAEAFECPADSPMVSTPRCRPFGAAD